MDAPVRENSEKSQWIKLKCPECRVGTIYILGSWENPPRFCDFCRARRVDNKERALRIYFKTLRNKKELTDEDKKELITMVVIEKKLDQLQKVHGENELAVFEELIQIKKVREVLIKRGTEVNKSRAETSRDKHHKVDFGTDRGSKFTGFVRGGLPSLGKKS
jgi:hypothetical protein